MFPLKNRIIFCTVSALIPIVFGSPSASAQTRPPYVEYSAKFLCGVPGPDEMKREGVKPGNYATAINIHNPQIFANQPPISFVKKAVLSQPEGFPQIPPSRFKQDALKNDFAEEVDCQTIRELLGSLAPPAPAFIEGFVVIIVSPIAGTTAPTPELDVVGVYSSEPPPVKGPAGPETHGISLEDGFPPPETALDFRAEIPT